MNPKNTAVRRLQAQAGKSDLLQFWYTYTLNIGQQAIAGTFTNSLANNTSGTATTQIQADSTFLLQYLTGVLIPTDGSGILAIATANAQIQITDTSSGATLFDVPLYVGNVLGTGQLPFVSPVARLFPANSALQLTLQNNTGKTIVAQFALLGQKLYEQG